MPKIPPKFSKPLNSSGRAHEVECISVSRRVLIEICRGVDHSALPEEVRAILEGASTSRTITMDQMETMVNAQILENTPNFTSGHLPSAGQSQLSHADSP